MPPAKNKLSQMGLIFATALVIGNMIGSGVFLLPASLAQYGAISILGWVFTALGAVILALTFAWLARLLPALGGPYAYVRHTFGDFAGFWVAWGYWIAVWAGNAAIAVSFVGYMTAFIPHLRQHLYAGLGAIFLVWIVTVINMRNIKYVGALQSITTILKLIPLLFVATVGWFFVHFSNYTPFNASSVSPLTAITAVATLTLWGFIGIESATIPATHIKNPEKTIPRATIIGTVITAIIYILSTMAIMGILPAAELKNSVAPFADATKPILGEAAYYLFAAAGAISCLGALNGWILIQGQMPMSAAQDGLFPSVFGEMNKANLPAKGVFISSILITLLLTLNFHESLVSVFTFTILLATFTTLVPYLFCAVALPLMLIKKENRMKLKTGNIIAILIIATLAFIYTFWTIYGAGAQIVFFAFLLLLLGIPIYAWQKWQLAKLAGEK